MSRALETADARGATSLVDAAWTSVLLAHGNDRPTLVLIFSDGADTASWLRVPPVVALASRANLVVDAVVAGGARLLRQPRRAPQPIAAAASAGGPRDAGVESFLGDLTAATGGSVIDGSGGSRLEGAFVAALREFRTRYQLSYTPTGVDHAGWHPLDVQGAPPGCNASTSPARGIRNSSADNPHGNPTDTHPVADLRDRRHRLRVRHLRAADAAADHQAGHRRAQRAAGRSAGAGGMPRPRRWRLGARRHRT